MEAYMFPYQVEPQKELNPAYLNVSVYDKTFKLFWSSMACSYAAVAFGYVMLNLFINFMAHIWIQNFQL